MNATNLQWSILASIADGEWYALRDIKPYASDDVYRRMAKNGLIERRVARGVHYGVDGPTRVKITPLGSAMRALPSRRNVPALLYVIDLLRAERPTPTRAEMIAHCRSIWTDDDKRVAFVEEILKRDGIQ